MFLFGKNDKARMSKVIEGKIHLLGNTKNNHFVFKKNKFQKNIKSIMFISSAYYTSALKQDKIIFRHLIKFCRERKIKIFFYGRQSRNHKKGESFYRNYFEKGDWIYLPRVSTHKTYTNLNNQQMIVFAHSTLGFQAIAKGIKCAVFYECFPEKGARGKFPRSGPFWSNLNDYKTFAKVTNRVMKCPSQKWNNITKKYSKDILGYDPNNLKKKKIIDKILKNN
jgi:surface carbohydrate biosynthesis protein